MSSSIKTILIIGATSGIGEAFARRFHSMGKQVIATGRRRDRLSKLQEELPGLETYVMDNADLSSLPGHVAELTRKFPTIDTVWINSGVQNAFKIADTSTSSDDRIADEVTINITAPMILTRLFVPHLLAQQEATIMITTSGLAFVPMPVYPVYCPTKAAMHAFCVILRQSLKDTNVHVIEIAPPKVSTELDANHVPGTGSKSPSLSIQEYTDETFKILDGHKASDLKEVAVGFAAMGASAWRGSIGQILERMNLGD